MKTHIVIHHSATPDGTVYRDFDSLRRGHLARGFRDIGYHWVIERVNGALTAIPGRAEWESGAHCVGRNVDGIGVCVIGNFEEEIPIEEQYRLLARLCREIMSRHPIWEIGGHKDYDATLCPGRNFDMERLRNMTKEGNLWEDVKVIVKGTELQGKLIDGQTYVPLRPVVEAINYIVVWQGPDKPVIVE